MDETERVVTVSDRRLLARLRHAGRALSWGVADQGVSSLSNFAVNIYVARLLGAQQYGTFGVVFVTYAVALSASRGLVTDPLMVRFSHVDRPTWRRVAAGCTGAAAAFGLVLGVVLLVAAALLGGTLGLGFVALAITTPGLLLQDSWRFAFFSSGRGAQSFLNDLVWVVILVPALAALQWAQLNNVFWAVLAWGGSATLAAVVGGVQAHIAPRLLKAWQWLATQRDLGFRYMAEGTTYSMSGQLRTYGIGLLLGLAAVGYVQAAWTLMAPVVVLLNGTNLIFLPEVTRLWRESVPRLVRFCVAVTLAFAVMAALWAALLLVFLPRGLGQHLLNDIWGQTYALVLPTALGVMGLSVAASAGTALKGTGAARRCLRAALMMSVMSVVFSVAGALAYGTDGAVWGTTLAQWGGGAVFWWQFLVALRESGRADLRWAVPGRRLVLRFLRE